MRRASIRSDVRVGRRDRVSLRHFTPPCVTPLRCPEQHLEVHQVVDDHGILPRAARVRSAFSIPRLDSLHLWIVPARETGARVDNNLPVIVVSRQIVAMTEAVENDEAKVVRSTNI